MLGALSVNVFLHDTYFVVGHFHYIKFGGGGFAFFAGLHYWFPKVFGRMYPKKVANAALFILFAGFNALYFPMLLLGLEGMPRRYFDYPQEYDLLQHISIYGSWALTAGLLLMFGNLAYSLFKGERAKDNPWGGATLEWQTSSPPPKENFEAPPEVLCGPYDYRRIREGGM